MLRFFFDILGPKGETIDDVGQEFEGQACAFDAAVEVLTEVVREDSSTLQAQSYWCRVRDCYGVPVFRCDISVACSILSNEMEDDPAQRVSLPLAGARLS